MNQMQIPLNKLPIGRKANVASILAVGTARRRMLDLGMIRGTEVEALFRSPSGNPVAYQIRGAVIALRNDVSEKIIVTAC